MGLGEDEKNTYIPYDHGSRLPFDADVEIGTERDVVIEEFQDGFAFFLFITDDGAGDFFISKLGQHVISCFVRFQILLHCEFT